MDRNPNQSQRPCLSAIAAFVFLAHAAVGQAATINVTGLTDQTGSCDATGSPVLCTSLRAAVIYANGNAGADAITLPAGEYVLSIDGVDETWSGTGTEADPYVASITADASKGDLDITDSVTITGELGGVDADQLVTTIRWDAKSITDPNVGDRIFHIQGLVTGAPVNATLANLILRDGSVGVTPNTDCSVVTNPYDIEIIAGDACSIWQFRRMGGAVAIGPGAAVVLYEQAIHGPVEPGTGGGGGSGVPRGPYPGGKPGGEEPETGVIESVTLSKVAIIGNQAGADAGGVYNAGPTTIEKSVLSGNTGGTNGGAIYNDAAMTISETTLGKATSIPFLVDAIAAEASLLATGNSAEGGGALFDTGTHTTTINASSIVGNSATGGAGIGARSLVVINVTNSTISGNSAKDVGGGITTNGTVNLKSSTVAFNDAASDAPGGGGGLNSFGQGTYNLLNSIVSNNVRNSVDSNCGCSGGAATCAPGRIVSQGHNLENAETCQLDMSSDLTSTDPLLKVLAANPDELTETHALPHTQAGDAVDSPAVDAGDNGECPNNDQRGSIRPFDGNLNFKIDCDIGAYELFIATADLHIDNMTAPDKVNKNDTVTVTVEVHNPTGQINGIDNVDATNVVLTAVVDSALANPSANFVKTGGASTACTVSGTSVTCAVGTLLRDQVVVMTLTATAGTTGTYDVSAAVTSDNKDLLPGNNVDSVSIAVIGYSDLQLAGSASARNLEVGQSLSVTYTVTNAAGSDAASNVRLGIAHTNQLAFDSTSTAGVTCVANDGEVNCALGGLAAQGSVTVTLLFKTLSAGEGALSATVVSDQNDVDESNNGSALAVTLKAPVVPTGDDTATGSKGGGGKNFFGCSATGSGEVDPLLPLLLVLGFAGLYTRASRRPTSPA